MTSKYIEAAEAFIAAGERLAVAAEEELGRTGAVQWVQLKSGKFAAYTRGTHADDIIQLIASFGHAHVWNVDSASMEVGAEITLKPQRQRVTFISLPYGTMFHTVGGTSLYRKLDGTAFECVSDAGDRITGFKAFDDVEIVK